MRHCMLVHSTSAGLRHALASTLATSFFVVVSLSPATAEDKADKASTGWVLTHHSFEKTLSYDDRLGDWLASASTMPLRDRLQILPPVPDRYGLFWNKVAAQTRDF